MELEREEIAKRHISGAYIQILVMRYDAIRCDAKRHAQQVLCQERLVLTMTVFPFCRMYKYSIERRRKETEKRNRSAMLRVTVRKCVFQKERKKTKG